MARKKVDDRLRPVVLVVDSDRSELTRLATILRNEGYEVLEADTFQAAMSSLQSAPTRVLITTVRLGPYNGLHLIVRCRISRPEVVSILTHNEDDSMLRDEAALNDAAFLLRPCSPEILTHAVAASLGRG